MTTVGAPSGAGSRLGIWNGKELIIWSGGGRCSPYGLCDGGARYDPAQDRWTSMSEAGAPAARDEHAAVAAGEKLMIWGGRCSSGRTACGDGAVYDPTSDSWSTFSAAGAPSPRAFAVGAWTGREFFVWGGMDPGAVQLVDSGGLYDPSTTTWRTVAAEGAPSGRAYHSVVWTGTELIVWGGEGDVSVNSGRADGAAYDPAQNSWRALPMRDAPAGRWAHTAIWTGTEMIIWGGIGCGVDGAGDPNICTGGARYNPATNVWAPITHGDEPSVRSGHTAVWTGREMIVWGGSGGECADACRDGGAYDPVTDSWRALQLSPLVTPRTDHIAVWTGSSMIVWGGVASEAASGSRDGLAFTPNSP